MGKKEEEPLTFDEYQERARDFVFYPDEGKNFAFPALGLAGEVGEAAKIVVEVMEEKGGVIDEETREKLGNELGDALWYMGALAGEISLTLDQVAEANLEKLASRKERGVLRGSGDDR